MVGPFSWVTLSIAGVLVTVGLALGLLLGMALVVASMRHATRDPRLRPMCRAYLDKLDGRAPAPIQVPHGSFPENVTCRTCDRRLPVPAASSPLVGLVNFWCPCGAQVTVRRSEESAE